jgi:hypothetical protein
LKPLLWASIFPGPDRYIFLKQKPDPKWMKRIKNRQLICCQPIFLKGSQYQSHINFVQLYFSSLFPLASETKRATQDPNL